MALIWSSGEQVVTEGDYRKVGKFSSEIKIRSKCAKNIENN